MPFDLDAPCGRRLRFRDLIECGSTFLEHAERYSAGIEPAPLANIPEQELTWTALRSLASEVIDRVEAQFGVVRLTYGFCSPALERAVGRRAKAEGRSPRISPALDQHAAHEVRNGKLVCARGGAAVDFALDGVSSEVVGSWLLKNAPVDRVYLYGADRPLHVSWASEPGGLGYRITLHPSGRWVPGRW